MNSSGILKFLASGLYSGYSPIIPGTTGTVPAWLLAYFLIGELLFPYGMIIAAVLCTAVSVFVADKAEKIWGHDDRRIVLDEWSGMFITLILVPYSLLNYIIAFFWWRLFDVVKIPPSRQAEKFPGGWGVTFDDVIAGVQACLITHLSIYLISTYI